MHIKTLTIQGFKSYRDQVATDPFSPRHNVVVGRNGSGKSNFFAAIRFVLADAYTSMTRDERQRLLHEGTSTTTTLSAYVEIVFDNSDGRFPTSLSTTTLRRTIGLKKDEYSLDKKSTSKAEVMNLLESAGFSKANPYYIVPQGRITHLTNIGDKERLELLKDVAGTKVYEQRRGESTKLIEETDVKRQKINDLLTYIEERLTELEEEKEELKEYQEKDKERRCLEYAFHQRDLEEVTAALEVIEEERRKDVDQSNQKRSEFVEREKAIQELEQRLTSLKHSLSNLSIANSQAETEMADLVRERTEVECDIADAEEEGEGAERRRKAINKELKSIDKRIIEVEKELKTVVPEWEERVAEERAAKERLDETQSKLKALYAKQGRAAQFPTQAARDAFLQGEVTSLQMFEAQHSRQLGEVKADVDEAERRADEAEANVGKQEQDDQERREKIASYAEEIADSKVEVDRMHEKRKELWREDGKLSQTVQNARVSLQTAERALQGMMDKDTSNGLSAVEKTAKRMKLDGVYGPLYSLLEVEDKYKTATEITGGNSLFQVVVDNEETASKLIEQMSRDKSGRVTFMPLNRLKSQPVNYPKADDAVALISKIRFDRKYAMAFEHVFGRTVVCPDLSIAATYTRSHGLNAITLDGDRVDRKGSITGGYHDVRRSRLDAIKAVKAWRATYEKDAARAEQIKTELSKLEQAITNAVGKGQVLEGKRKTLIASRSTASAKASWAEREATQARDRLERLRAVMQDVEAALREAQTKRESYEEEIKTPMRQVLSDDELALMERLSKDLEGHKKEVMELSRARADLTSRKSLLEIELTESLRRNREELRSKLDAISTEETATTVDDPAGQKKHLQTLVQAIDELSDKIAENEAEIETLTTQIATSQAKYDEHQAAQLDNSRSILKSQKNAERFLTKRTTLSSRKDECNKSIRDLGILPEEAYHKYTSVRSDKLLKSLRKVTDGLKKFAHVNKKAFEQYNNFTKQRDDLLKRREELDTSSESIQELIGTLDQRKDEAIARTFKQVSKYFEEVFEKLVPAGRGRLVMQRKIDDESQNETDKSSIENYTGVSIQVSFNSKKDEGQRIQQLSGGQKSLVALATVFAIQKCDPAPFYLFDEIDANLDAQYRTAVAAMIHELSSTAQFITTTFRGEMLAQADKFYGVLFSNQKVSSIQVITKEDAQTFIEVSA